MMRRLLLSVLVVCGFVGCQNGDMPRTIPEFSMVLPDTTKVFHSKDIPYGKTAMIIVFDPACRDCQEETEHILANLNRFSEVNIYLVTRHPYEEMMVFHDHLRLDTCRNIKIGIDKTGAIPRQLKIRSTPLTLIYNRDKILRAVFSGKPKSEELIEVVNKKV